MPLTLEQAAEHPGGFFVHLEALGQQISTGLIIRRIGQGEHAARCPGNRFMARYQFPDHVQGSGVLFGF